MIACALFSPYPFWQACWDDPVLKDKALITLKQGKVELASTKAKQAGIQKGMSLAGARAYSSQVQVIETDNAQLSQQWQSLLNDLYSFSYKLESPAPGIAYLDLSPNEAKQLASYYGARVALASSKERAHLIALTAFEGIARIPEHEDLFLAKMPTYYLKGIGLKEKLLDRLRWLGIEKLGQLLAWRRSQAEAFFGIENKSLLSYLYGPFSNVIETFTPAKTISLNKSFDDPLSEPYMIEPYLRLLAWEATAYLGDKSARYIHLTLKSKGLSFKESKKAKYPLNDAKIILRHALALLYKSDALAFGIENLKLELSGLYRMSEQGELFQQKENLAKAIQDVEERFPDALLKFREVDPHALISEYKYDLIHLSTGEAVNVPQHHNEEQLARAA